MNDEYVKLVRPDLTAFYDGNFKWPLSGIVEVPNASPNGACGVGLHLGRSVDKAMRSMPSGFKFPFRILRVRPLSPVLGEDENKVRVAKAEVLGEIKMPAHLEKLRERLEALPAEMRAIPWFKGGADPKKVKTLMKSHFKLLVPFGFDMDWKLEIITEREKAGSAYGDAARNAAWDAACDAAWAAAGDAARNAAGDAAWSASGIRRPNPFAPMLEVWKLGAWPIGFVGNAFKVWVGEAKDA